MKSWYMIYDMYDKEKIDIMKEKIDIMINDIKQDMYEKKQYLNKRYKSGYVRKVDTW